jgi:large subunit ribosomal protein L32e
MSAAKKEIKELSDLPYFKEEHAKVLAEMDITTPAQLLEKLQDPDGYEELITKKKLKGIGEKHADTWMELLEESVEEEKAPTTVETVIEQPEVDQKLAKMAKKTMETVIVEEAPAEVVEKGGYVAKKKPELTANTKVLLAKREEIDSRRPAFLRQEWFRFSRLGEKWRKPRGIHSKMRRHYGYRPPIVSIGYRGPKDVRGYHPSGFMEVMVHNPAQLEKMDPKTQAARVGGTVGFKKKLAIEKRADELGIRVLNRTG